MKTEGERERRVRLRDGLERTASSVILKDDGSMVVELYDFSGATDVAFLVTVGASDRGAVLDRLGGDDDSLLALVEERFGDYFEIVRWLDENGVPYRKDFDSWA